MSTRKCLMVGLLMGWAMVIPGAPRALAKLHLGHHFGSRQEDSKKASPASPASPTSPAQPRGVRSEGEYIIGNDDVLVVNVWREPEISRTLPVRPDGRISLPLIGEVEARGLTPPQLQAQLTDKLQTYVAHPQVTVIVQEVKSQRFNVVGEVQHPGAFDLAKPMTVLDGIAVAGGFADFAKTAKVYVLRKSDNGQSQRIQFNYKDVVSGKDPGQNVALRSGDTIIVP